MSDLSVFVSYSTADSAFVEQVLVPSLEAAGARPWYSARDIRTSVDWEEAIRGALEAADWFLVVMSPSAQASEWVRDEVLWAVDHRPTRIIPVLIDDCDPRQIHMRLARIQQVDFRGPTDGATKRLFDLLGCEDAPIPPRNRQLKACRLIPFFLGEGATHPTGQAYGFPSFECAGATVAVMDAHFVVAFLDEDVVFSDPVDFLVKRRERHLELLKPDSALLAGLTALRKEGPPHPVISESPDAIPYVMSVHSVEASRCVLSETELRCLAEPSVLGISDDPNDLVDEARVLDAHRALEACTISSGSVDVIRHGSDVYYVSWANVMLAASGDADHEFARLVRTEALLQHLWYRMHLYSQSVDGLLDRTDRFEARAARAEMLKTKMQFAQFCKVNPTGATHLNELQESLVRTSKLRELYADFLLAEGYVNELEALS